MRHADQRTIDRSLVARPRVLALLAALGAYASSPARADGIPPPPVCPDGTSVRGCHGPGYCQPIACTADSDCTGGAVCRDVSYCVSSFYCGGGRPPPDASSSGFATTSATRACADGCVAGETCTPSRVCVPPGSSVGPRHTTYCGCLAAGAARSGTGAVLATIVFVIAMMTRRRGDPAVGLGSVHVVRR